MKGRGVRGELRRLSRWLAVLAAIAIAALAAVGIAGFVVYARADVSTVGELRFTNELAIPPLLSGELDGEGRRVFELDLQSGEAELLPGRRTETWGVNGAYLGPTLRASRGERVLVRARNELSAATTLHWHGMHLPASADGGPHQVIEPGATWAPGWRIDQPAATLWYHPHLHRQTAEHVYRGIAGLFIIDDPAARRLSLPHDYGVDDIPLIIQDKRFDGDGSLDFSYRLISPTGFLGDTLLVNGSFDPHLDVSSEHVRFRLLNASNARVYNLGFSDNRRFHLIASDGGLLQRPHPTTRVQLSPGERAEIVVRFASSERVVLRSIEPELGANFWEERFAGGDDSFGVLGIRAASTLAPASHLPSRLARLQLARQRDAVRVRRFKLSGTSHINSRKMDLRRIDEVVTAATSEIWEVTNSAGTVHSFHPHGVSFRVLDHGGRAPAPELAGLKDTVFIAPGKTVRLLVHFGDYADPNLPYMLHCHILEHEDRGMMGQFVVVHPGQQAGRPPDSHQSGDRG
jgi:blue copper oxidase